MRSLLLPYSFIAAIQNKKAFGQSSTSPFGSHSIFGQSNNVNSNASAPNPFGNAPPFGSQTGGSVFGGALSGVLGATLSSSPFASTPTFGSLSTPTLGNSVPAFGTSLAPAYGTGSSSFGGSSVFGQTPAFGLTPSQTDPFGAAPSQINPFGSTAPAFGAPSGSAAFGASRSGSGASSSPFFNFNSSPFGQSNSAVGSTPFGITLSPFVAQSPSSGIQGSKFVFGGGSRVISYSPTRDVDGSGKLQSISAMLGYYKKSQEELRWEDYKLGDKGTQAAASAFSSPDLGQSGFGARRVGSRVTSYSPTVEVDGGSSTQATGKLDSISAMHAYKDKSHEELRWEDYKSGDKGGPGPAAEPNLFRPSLLASGQSPANLFSASTSWNPLRASTPNSNPSPFGSPTTSNPFSATTSWNPFRSSTQNSNPSPFGSTTTVNLFGVTAPTTPSTENDTTDEEKSSLCSICWSAPKEGVCVPCLHATACMSCLNKIQNKKCPICRKRIQQVVKIFIT